MDIYLAIIDKSSFVVSQQLKNDINNYMKAYYLGSEKPDKKRFFQFKKGLFKKENELSNDISANQPLSENSFDEARSAAGETFLDVFLSLKTNKNKTDAEVYKNANIDYNLFLTICSNRDFIPKKSTVLALAIALELSLEETKYLLAYAGYTLSYESKFDIIVEYFIVNGYYNIYKINELLFLYDLPLLGA